MPVFNRRALPHAIFSYLSSPHLSIDGTSNTGPGQIYNYYVYSPGVQIVPILEKTNPFLATVFLYSGKLFKLESQNQSGGSIAKGFRFVYGFEIEPDSLDFHFQHVWTDRDTGVGLRMREQVVKLVQGFFTEDPAMNAATVKVISNVFSTFGLSSFADMLTNEFSKVANLIVNSHMVFPEKEIATYAGIKFQSATYKVSKTYIAYMSGFDPIGEAIQDMEHLMLAPSFFNRTDMNEGCEFVVAYEKGIDTDIPNLYYTNKFLWLLPQFRRMAIELAIYYAATVKRDILIDENSCTDNNANITGDSGADASKIIANLQSWADSINNLAKSIGDAIKGFVTGESSQQNQTEQQQTYQEMVQQIINESNNFISEKKCYNVISLRTEWIKENDILENQNIFLGFSSDSYVLLTRNLNELMSSDIEIIRKDKIAKSEAEKQYQVAQAKAEGWLQQAWNWMVYKGTKYVAPVLTTALGTVLPGGAIGAGLAQAAPEAAQAFIRATQEILASASSAKAKTVINPTKWVFDLLLPEGCFGGDSSKREKMIDLILKPFYFVGIEQVNFVLSTREIIDLNNRFHNGEALSTFLGNYQRYVTPPADVEQAKSLSLLKDFLSAFNVLVVLPPGGYNFIPYFGQLLVALFNGAPYLTINGQEYYIGYYGIILHNIIRFQSKGTGVQDTLLYLLPEDIRIEMADTYLLPYDFPWDSANQNILYTSIAKGIPLWVKLSITFRPINDYIHLFGNYLGLDKLITAFDLAEAISSEGDTGENTVSNSGNAQTYASSATPTPKQKQYC